MAVGMCSHDEDEIESHLGGYFAEQEIINMNIAVQVCVGLK